MKAKIIILLAVTAIVTLSFTFSSVRESDVKETTTTSHNEPAGGLASEDKF